MVEKCRFLKHIINTHKCSHQAAGREWPFWAWGIKSWAGEWRCMLTGRGRRLVERCQLHILAAEKNTKRGDGLEHENSSEMFRLRRGWRNRLSPWWTGRWLPTIQTLHCTEWWWWSDASQTGFPPLRGKYHCTHTLQSILLNVYFSRVIYSDLLYILCCKVKNLKTVSFRF